MVCKADIIPANDGDGDDVGAHQHTENRRVVRGGCRVNAESPPESPGEKRSILRTLEPTPGAPVNAQCNEVASTRRGE